MEHIKTIFENLKILKVKCNAQKTTLHNPLLLHLKRSFPKFPWKTRFSSGEIDDINFENEHLWTDSRSILFWPSEDCDELWRNSWQTSLLPHADRRINRDKQRLVSLRKQLILIALKAIVTQIYSLTSFLSIRTYSTKWRRKERVRAKRKWQLK